MAFLLPKLPQQFEALPHEEPRLRIVPPLSIRPIDEPRRRTVPSFWILPIELPLRRIVMGGLVWWWWWWWWWVSVQKLRTTPYCIKLRKKNQYSPRVPSSGSQAISRVFEGSAASFPGNFFIILSIFPKSDFGFN